MSPYNIQIENSGPSFKYRLFFFLFLGVYMQIWDYFSYTISDWFNKILVQTKRHEVRMHASTLDRKECIVHIKQVILKH